MMNDDQIDLGDAPQQLPAIGNFADVNVDVDDYSDDDVDEHINPAMEREQEKKQQERFKARLHSDLMFAVQGVGDNKTLGQAEVFVKHDHCEDSLKDLNRYLHGDSRFEPYVRLMLGDFEFMEKYLFPIVTLHKDDK